MGPLVWKSFQEARHNHKTTVDSSPRSNPKKRRKRKKKFSNKIIFVSINGTCEKCHADPALKQGSARRGATDTHARLPFRACNYCITAYLTQLSIPSLSPLCFYSQPKLATLHKTSRLCSRPQLWTRIASSASSRAPTNYHYLRLSSSLNPTPSSRSFGCNAREPHTTSRIQSAQRPRISPARASALRTQKRYCQSEVTSSFAIMASDRDILPAW